MRKLSMHELGRKSATECKEAEKTPIIIVLDNIRSMHNVGSIFRTADAFLIEAIVLCGITPQPPHREINKTALGATESVDWVYFSTTEEAVKQLRERGTRIYAVEQTEGSVSLEDTLALDTNNIAIILGNEVEGVGESVLPMVDGSIEIPQRGMKHSLNVSVAAGIVLWELSKARINGTDN